jgi:hypothetical protein
MERSFLAADATADYRGTERIALVQSLRRRAEKCSPSSTLVSLPRFSPSCRKRCQTGYNEPRGRPRAKPPDEKGASGLKTGDERAALLWHGRAAVARQVTRALDFNRVRFV